MNTLKIATTTFGITLILSLAFAQSNSAMMASSPDAATREMTGMVTDSICKGLNVNKAHTQYSCARDCVQLRGADYVLVVGPTIYTLQGDKTQLEKFVGGRATVKGQISGNRIAVESVTAARKGA